MKFLTTLIFIVIAVAIFGVGQALYEADVADNTTRDIYNLTESIFQWNSSNFETTKINMTDVINNTVTRQLLLNHRTKNILYKGFDFFGYSVFEVSKWGVEFGYEHPEYNFLAAAKAMPKYIKIVIGLVVAFLLIKLIIPLFAVCYIIGGGIKTLYQKYKKKEKPKKNKL